MTISRCQTFPILARRSQTDKGEVKGRDTWSHQPALQTRSSMRAACRGSPLCHSACCALGRRPRLRYTAPRGARGEWAPPHPAAMPHATWSRTMPERCTLDGFVITPIEPPGSLYAGTDHGRLFINEARTGVMAWWSMGRWTDGPPGRRSSPTP